MIRALLVAFGFFVAAVPGAAFYVYGIGWAPLSFLCVFAGLVDVAVATVLWPGFGPRLDPEGSRDA